jgi:hypothetical protein
MVGRVLAGAGLLFAFVQPLVDELVGLGGVGRLLFEGLGGRRTGRVFGVIVLRYMGEGVGGDVLVVGFNQFAIVKVVWNLMVVHMGRK